MKDLRDLYQQVILDHNRAPRNFRVPESPTREAEGNNPLCGDSLKVFVTLRDDVIEDVAFQGSGCAISKASSSLMTDSVKGKTIQEASELFDRFHAMVIGKDEGGDRSKLGKLAVFAGVSEYPARVKCASLPWHTLRAALNDTGVPASTE